MSKPEAASNIADEAARWAARLAHGEVTAESQAELETWLSADRRHRGAYLRARAGLIALEEAVVRERRKPGPGPNDENSPG